MRVLILLLCWHAPVTRPPVMFHNPDIYIGGEEISQKHQHQHRPRRQVAAPTPKPTSTERVERQQHWI